MASNQTDYELTNFTNCINHGNFRELNDMVNILKIVVFLTTYIFSTIGNLIIACVIVRTRRLWTFTNIMMLNYSFVTIIFLLFGLLQFISDFQFQNSWPFGGFLCKITYSSFIATGIVSAFSITLMCYARYRAICKPLHVQPNKKQALYCIVAIWVAAIAYTIPYGIVLNITIFRDKPYCLIHPSWQKQPDRSIYDFCLFALTFAVPLVAVAFFNIKVFSNLKLNSGQQSPVKRYDLSDDSRYRQQDESVDSVKEKLRKMSVIIFAIYLFAWLPFWIYVFLINSRIITYILSKYEKYDCHLRNKILIIRVFTKYLTYFYSVTNVVICYYCNPHFNAAFKSIFCCRLLSKIKHLVTDFQYSVNPDITYVTESNRTASHGSDRSTTKLNITHSRIVTDV